MGGAAAGYRAWGRAMAGVAVSLDGVEMGTSSVRPSWDASRSLEPATLLEGVDERGGRDI